MAIFDDLQFRERKNIFSFAKFRFIERIFSDIWTLQKIRGFLTMQGIPQSTIEGKRLRQPPMRPLGKKAVVVGHAIRILREEKKAREKKEKKIYEKKSQLEKYEKELIKKLEKQERLHRELSEYISKEKAEQEAKERQGLKGKVEEKVIKIKEEFIEMIQSFKTIFYDITHPKEFFEKLEVEKQKPWYDTERGQAWIEENKERRGLEKGVERIDKRVAFLQSEIARIKKGIDLEKKDYEDFEIEDSEDEIDQIENKFETFLSPEIINNAFKKWIRRDIFGDWINKFRRKL